jgi:DNA repair protein RadC
MSTLYHTNRRIKDMVASERPQERLAKHGAKALSDSEILAMILRCGPRGIDVLTMSSDLLTTAGSLTHLLRWTAADFQKIKGIGTVKSLQLMAVMDFARRILQEDDSVEHFWTLCLDRKNRLIQRVEVTVGTASSCLVHPREVFKEAIRLSASAILVAHNHPSGDPAPSRADIQVTRQLREAAKIIGIDLLDHIILGQKSKDPQGLGLYSFNEAGLI